MLKIKFSSSGHIKDDKFMQRRLMEVNENDVRALKRMNKNPFHKWRNFDEDKNIEINMRNISKMATVQERTSKHHETGMNFTRFKFSPISLPVEKCYMKSSKRVKNYKISFNNSSLKTFFSTKHFQSTKMLKNKSFCQSHPIMHLVREVETTHESSSRMKDTHFVKVVETHSKQPLEVSRKNMILIKEVETPIRNYRREMYLVKEVDMPSESSRFSRRDMDHIKNGKMPPELPLNISRKKTCLIREVKKPELPSKICRKSMVLIKEAKSLCELSSCITKKDISHKSIINADNFTLFQKNCHSQNLSNKISNEKCVKLQNMGKRLNKQRVFVTENKLTLKNEAVSKTKNRYKEIQRPLVRKENVKHLTMSFNRLKKAETRSDTKLKEKYFLSDISRVFDKNQKFAKITAIQERKTVIDTPVNNATIAVDDSPTTFRKVSKKISTKVLSNGCLKPHEKFAPKISSNVSVMFSSEKDNIPSKTCSAALSPTSITLEEIPEDISKCDNLEHFNSETTNISKYCIVPKSKTREELKNVSVILHRNTALENFIAEKINVRKEESCVFPINLKVIENITQNEMQQEKENERTQDTTPNSSVHEVTFPDHSFEDTLMDMKMKPLIFEAKEVVLKSSEESLTSVLTDSFRRVIEDEPFDEHNDKSTIRVDFKRMSNLFEGFKNFSSEVQKSSESISKSNEDISNHLRSSSLIQSERLIEPSPTTRPPPKLRKPPDEEPHLKTGKRISERRTENEISKDKRMKNKVKPKKNTSLRLKETRLRNTSIKNTYSKTSQKPNYSNVAVGKVHKHFTRGVRNLYAIKKERKYEIKGRILSGEGFKNFSSEVQKSSERISKSNEDISNHLRSSSLIQSERLIEPSPSTRPPPKLRKPPDEEPHLKTGKRISERRTENEISKDKRMKNKVKPKKNTSLRLKETRLRNTSVKNTYSKTSQKPNYSNVAVGKAHKHFTRGVRNLYAIKKERKYEIKGRILSGEKELAEHFKKEKCIHKCYCCDFSSASKSTFDKHLNSHKVASHFCCTLCPYSCTLRSKFVLHSRIHTGEKPYKCDICSYRSKSVSTLKIHKRTHSGERPYKCKLCSYRAICYGNICRHIRNHMGEKPYFCIFCKKHFSNTSNLRKHIASFHKEKAKGFGSENIAEKGKQYRCYTCLETFSSKWNLEKHKKKYHLNSRKLKCPLCLYTCNQYSAMNSHLSTHDATEQFPSYDFETTHAASMMNHQMLRDKEKSFKSNPIKTLSCLLCSQSFIKRGWLKKHMMTHHGPSKRTRSQNRQVKNAINQSKVDLKKVNQSKRKRSTKKYKTLKNATRKRSNQSSAKSLKDTGVHVNNPCAESAIEGETLESEHHTNRFCKEMQTLNVNSCGDKIEDFDKNVTNERKERLSKENLFQIMVDTKSKESPLPSNINKDLQPAQNFNVELQPVTFNEKPHLFEKSRFSPSVNEESSHTELSKEYAQTVNENSQMPNEELQYLHTENKELLSVYCEDEELKSLYLVNDELHSTQTVNEEPQQTQAVNEKPHIVLPVNNVMPSPQPALCEVTVSKETRPVLIADKESQPIYSVNKELKPTLNAQIVNEESQPTTPVDKETQFAQTLNEKLQSTVVDKESHLSRTENESHFVETTIQELQPKLKGSEKSSALTVNDEPQLGQKLINDPPPSILNEELRPLAIVNREPSGQLTSEESEANLIVNEKPQLAPIINKKQCTLSVSEELYADLVEKQQSVLDLNIGSQLGQNLYEEPCVRAINKETQFAEKPHLISAVSEQPELDLINEELFVNEELQSAQTTNDLLFVQNANEEPQLALTVNKKRQLGQESHLVFSVNKGSCFEDSKELSPALSMNEVSQFAFTLNEEPYIKSIYDHPALTVNKEPQFLQTVSKKPQNLCVNEELLPALTTYKFQPLLNVNEESEAIDNGEKYISASERSADNKDSRLYEQNKDQTQYDDIKSKLRIKLKIVNGEIVTGEVLNCESSASTSKRSNSCNVSHWQSFKEVDHAAMVNTSNKSDCNSSKKSSRQGMNAENNEHAHSSCHGNRNSQNVLETPNETIINEMPKAGTKQKFTDEQNLNTIDTSISPPNMQNLFTLKGTLKKIKIHSFKCSFCEFRTDKLFKLNLHLEDHSHFNPFECAFCPRTFSHSSQLKAHIKEHNEEEESSITLRSEVNMFEKLN